MSSTRRDPGFFDAMGFRHDRSRLGRSGPGGSEADRSAKVSGCIGGFHQVGVQDDIREAATRLGRALNGWRHDSAVFMATYSSRTFASPWPRGCLGRTGAVPGHAVSAGVGCGPPQSLSCRAGFRHA